MTANRKPVPARIGLSAVAFLALLTLGCGGDDRDPNPPDACMDFTPASGPQPGAVTSREGGGSGCDAVAVDLYVTDVDDVFAAVFTVAYDTTVASYQDLSVAGSLLSSDGAQVVTEVDTQPGRVVVGISRLGVDSGIDVAGTRLLARLTFRRESNGGNGFLTYSGASLRDSQEPPGAIPGVSWFGGTFVVN
jgi:hypothetical protein